MGEHDFIHLIQNVWNISVEYKISGGDPNTPSHGWKYKLVLGTTFPHLGEHDFFRLIQDIWNIDKWMETLTRP